MLELLKLHQNNDTRVSAQYKRELNPSPVYTETIPSISKKGTKTVTYLLTHIRWSEMGGNICDITLQGEDVETGDIEYIPLAAIKEPNDRLAIEMCLQVSAFPNNNE